MSIGASEVPPEIEPNATRAKPGAFIRWHRRVLGFCLVIFALELGLFLLVFPWRREWESNWIPVHSPRWAGLWLDGYFRGAVSGLGLMNIWVAAVELYRQIRSLLAQHPE